jgi:hypothetical protein
MERTTLFTEMAPASSTVAKNRRALRAAGAGGCVVVRAVAAGEVLEVDGAGDVTVPGAGAAGAGDAVDCVPGERWGSARGRTLTWGAGAVAGSPRSLCQALVSGSRAAMATATTIAMRQSQNRTPSPRCRAGAARERERERFRAAMVS